MFGQFNQPNVCMHIHILYCCSLLLSRIYMDVAFQSQPKEKNKRKFLIMNPESGNFFCTSPHTHTHQTILCCIFIEGDCV